VEQNALATPALESHPSRDRAAARNGYTRPPPGTALDARTREGKLLARTRADLIASLGGSPTTTQRLLVDQAAMLTVRLWQSNAGLEAGKPSTEAETKHYVALANSLQRILLRLSQSDATAAKPSGPSLADFLAEHARQKAEATA